MHTQNISITSLVTSSGIERTRVSRLLSGDRTPSYGDIEKISNAVKVDPSIFFPDRLFPICGDYIYSPTGLSEVMPAVKPFRCGILYTIIGDDFHKMVSFNVLFSKDVDFHPTCPIFKGFDTGVKKVISVTNGEVSFKYSHGESVVKKDCMYSVLGYEEQSKVVSGTRVTVFMVGADRSSIETMFNGCDCLSEVFN